jgi:hypothetical protein
MSLPEPIGKQSLRRAFFLRHMSTRARFVKSGMVLFGLPFGIFLVLAFGRHGGLGWWTYLVAIAVAVAWGWARATWWIMRRDIEAHAAAIESEKRKHGSEKSPSARID